MIRIPQRGGSETRRIVTINRRHTEPPKPESEKIGDKTEPQPRDVAMSLDEMSRKYLGGEKR